MTTNTAASDTSALHTHTSYQDGTYHFPPQPSLSTILLNSLFNSISYRALEGVVSQEGVASCGVGVAPAGTRLIVRLVSINEDTRHKVRSLFVTP